MGGRVFKIPPYQHPVAYRKALLRLFRAEHWTIVHSHINTLSVFSLSAAKAAGVPVRIAHSHSTMGKGEYGKNLMKLALRPFATVYPTHRFACSNYAGTWLFGEAGFSVIPNAIELRDFRFSEQIRQQVRSELGLAPDTLLIGHVGRFMPQKNQFFLVDALLQLLHYAPNTMLAFVGDGPDKESVTRYVQQHGVQDHVFFLGQRSDVNRLYQAFDVFCLPSIYEGLGIVGIEAQRAGLPCFFSDAVPREVDITGSARFLPIKSPDVWAESLRECSVAKRLSFPDQLFESYDIDEQGKSLTDLYERLYSALDEHMD